jgi:Big-like domain-containing protein
MLLRSVVLALAVAALMPLSGAAQQEPSATDGQHLSDQPSDVQALFVVQWGPAAAQEWVAERNAQIARLASPLPAPVNPALPLPQVVIASPTVGQNVSTAADFTIRGTASDPLMGPRAIDRVEIWMNGWRNTPGAVPVGLASLDGGGGWGLTFLPTKFPSMNSNLFVYVHSSYSGNTAVGMVNFNIADPH